MAVAITGAAQAEAATQYYQLVARHSGMCLDVAWKSYADEADIVQAACNPGLRESGRTNQYWAKVFTSDGYYKLVAEHSRKCLDVWRGNWDQGGRIIQYTCWGGNNQQWAFDDLHNGYYQIISRHTGMCLDVAWRSATHGAPVVQATCRQNHNQQWKVVAIPPFLS
jgi:hypothetical protein